MASTRRKPRVNYSEISNVEEADQDQTNPPTAGSRPRAITNNRKNDKSRGRVATWAVKAAIIH